MGHPGTICVPRDSLRGSVTGAFGRTEWPRGQDTPGSAASLAKDWRQTSVLESLEIRRPSSQSHGLSRNRDQGGRRPPGACSDAFGQHRKSHCPAPLNPIYFSEPQATHSIVQGLRSNSQAVCRTADSPRPSAQNSMVDPAPAATSVRLSPKLASLLNGVWYRSQDIARHTDDPDRKRSAGQKAVRRPLCPASSNPKPANPRAC